MGKTTITTRIRLSLLCVFAIMFVVALYLFIQFRSVGKDTETLYEHPFLVSNTLREIKIDLHKDYGYLHFGAQANFNTPRLIMLVQKYSKTYQPQGKDKVRISFSSDDINDRIQAVENLILDIS